MAFGLPFGPVPASGLPNDADNAHTYGWFRSAAKTVASDPQATDYISWTYEEVTSDDDGNLTISTEVGPRHEEPIGTLMWS